MYIIIPASTPNIIYWGYNGQPGIGPINNNGLPSGPRRSQKGHCEPF